MKYIFISIAFIKFCIESGEPLRDDSIQFVCMYVCIYMVFLGRGQICSIQHPKITLKV